MTTAEKALAKLRRLPPEMPIREVGVVLEAHGWRRERQSGSHVIFVHGDTDETLSVPLKSGRQVTRTYLKQILQRTAGS